MTTRHGWTPRYPTFARGGWRSGRGHIPEVRTFPGIDIPNLPRLPERVGVPAPQRFPSRPIPPVTLPRSIPAVPATRTQHQHYPWQLGTPFYPGVTPGLGPSLPPETGTLRWPLPTPMPLPQPKLDPLRVERRTKEDYSPDSGFSAKLYKRRRKYPWLI